jgi:hypothetical protein
MDLATWLADMVKPIATRAMVALGFGTVTYTGATSAIDGAVDSVRSTLGGLTADIAQLLAMSGIFDALAIASGSLTTAVAMMVLKKFALQTGGAS